MKTNLTGYGCLDESGDLNYNTIARTMREVREYAEECTGELWKELKSQGYKIIKITITTGGQNV